VYPTNSSAARIIEREERAVVAGIIPQLSSASLASVLIPKFASFCSDPRLRTSKSKGHQQVIVSSVALVQKSARRIRDLQ
jgi:hypothetical protein